MTSKQRFMQTMTFGSPDRAPMMEICLWSHTRQRWISEGMPPEVDGSLMTGCDYFGLEGYDSLYLNATGPHPPVEEKVLAEDADHVTFIDAWGRTRMARKSGTVDGMRLSMDTYIAFPVRDRQSFAQFRHRFEGPPDERYPQDYPQVKTVLAGSEKPLTLLNPLAGTFGYYSMLRNWMGTEGVSYLLYDDPALIEECLEFLTDFAIRVLEKAARETRFDFYFIHEDMSFKNGPLVSPEMFRRFFMPHYKRFISFLRGHGINLILVDTDGNHEVLTPLFLEAGVNGFGPMERAAGMDPVATRRQYGRSLVMLGGVDKREIAKGRRAIEREVAQSIAPIIDQGGYIPTIDHSIPPDISLEDFRYYLDLKRKVIGVK